MSAGTESIRPNSPKPAVRSTKPATISGLEPSRSASARGWIRWTGVRTEIREKTPSWIWVIPHLVGADLAIYRENSQ